LRGAFAALLSPDRLIRCKLGGLHANLLHLAYNSLALLYFGPVLENALGSPRFLAVYLGAGVSGTATSFAFTHPVLSVGASGAVLGVGGALSVFFWRRRQVTSGIWVLVATILVLNLGLGAMTLHVDVAAHLGGLVAGLAATALLDVGFARRRLWLSVAGLAAPVMLAGALAVVGTATFTPSGAFPSCPTELL
jgi:rhomboid protease GluP